MPRLLAYTYTADSVTKDGYVYHCLVQDEVVTDGPDCFPVGYASTTLTDLSRGPFVNRCITMQRDSMPIEYCYDPFKAQVGIILFVVTFVFAVWGFVKIFKTL